MGGLVSSEENIDEKVVDSTGHVNNNIVIQEARDTHEQLRTNERMLNVTYIICAVAVLKLGLYLYCKFIRKLKKKYNRNNIAVNQGNVQNQ